MFTLINKAINTHACPCCGANSWIMLKYERWGNSEIKCEYCENVFSSNDKDFNKTLNQTNIEKEIQQKSSWLNNVNVAIKELINEQSKYGKGKYIAKAIIWGIINIFPVGLSDIIGDSPAMFIWFLGSILTIAFMIKNIVKAVKVNNKYWHLASQIMDLYERKIELEEEIETLKFS